MTVSHQTARLSRGRHQRPSDGTCVMELASMLAGEPFSDHPQTASPVIGDFLRMYNDSVDDHLRQELYRFAAAVVGTRAGADIERARADMCWTAVPRLPGRIGRILPQLEGGEGRRAAKALARRGRAGYAEAARLLDRMIALSGAAQPDDRATRPLSRRAPAIACF